MPSGEIVEMKLAEMGSLVGSGKNLIWMREVRKLTASGHQTSLISTAYDCPLVELAARLFSRWCQENFFGYMMKHFAIDRVMQYGTLELPDTEKVINPEWRLIQKQLRTAQHKLQYRRARFAEMTIHPKKNDDSEQYENWLEKMAELYNDIEHLEQESAEIKIRLKGTAKYIEWKDLKDDEKFHQLKPARKQLMDTVRMVAYRAETAMMVLIVGPRMNGSEARDLLQNLFVSAADISLDEEKKELTVNLHGAAVPSVNIAIKQLLHHLNETETVYPGTDLVIRYTFLSESC